jgi:hypothetical protein
VLGDLRPYQCLEEGCSAAESTYSHLKDLKTHYKVHHLAAAMMDTTVLSCVFCGEDLALTLRARFSHVGRHIVEISFTVIPRPYEDWEFYSESTMAIPRDLLRRSNMPLPPSSRPKQKPSDLWSQLGSSVQPGQDGSKFKKRPQRESTNPKEDCWSFWGASRKDKKDARSDFVALDKQQKLETAKKDDPAEVWSGKRNSRKDENKIDPAVASIDHNVNPREDDDIRVAFAWRTAKKTKPENLMSNFVHETGDQGEQSQLWGAGVSKKDRKKRRTFTERVSHNPEPFKRREWVIPVKSLNSWSSGTS